MFICDISFDAQNNSNPNVLIELGYAIKCIGWSKIICLFDLLSGSISDLPFDINHNRVTVFNSEEDDEVKRISSILVENITKICNDNSFLNPIEDAMKMKIDKIYLDIFRNIVNIIYFEKNIEFTSVIKELCSDNISEIQDKISKAKSLGFFYLFNYDYQQKELNNLYDKMTYSNLYSNDWKTNTLRLINWMDSWMRTFQDRFNPGIIKIISNSEYEIKDMYFENPQNPPTFVVLLKKIDKDRYRAVQGGYAMNDNRNNKIVELNNKYYNEVSNVIMEFINITDEWLKFSGDTFLLDPKFYVIKTKKQS